MEMQLELNAPMFSRQGGSLKKVFAAGGLAIAGFIAFSTRSGNVAEFDLAQVKEPATWDDLKSAFEKKLSGSGKAFSEVSECVAKVNTGTAAEKKKKNMKNRKKCAVAVAKKISSVDTAGYDLGAKKKLAFVKTYRDNIIKKLEEKYGADVENATVEKTTLNDGLKDVISETFTLFKEKLECATAVYEKCKSELETDDKKKACYKALVDASGWNTGRTMSLAREFGVVKKDNVKEAKACVDAVETKWTRYKSKFPTEKNTNIDKFITEGKKALASGTNILLIITLCLLGIALVGGAGYYFYMQQKKKKSSEIQKPVYGGRLGGFPDHVHS